MTAATDALASAIGDRTDPSNINVAYGVVVSNAGTGAKLRVDSAGMKLSCSMLNGVSALVGDAVWVLQVGTKNIIIGVDTTLPVLYKFGVVNVTTSAAGFATITFPTPFPTICDGAVLTNSSNPANAYPTIFGLSAAAISVFVVTTSTGGGLVSTNLPALFYWAWGR